MPENIGQNIKLHPELFNSSLVGYLVVEYTSYFYKTIKTTHSRNLVLKEKYLINSFSNSYIKVTFSTFYCLSTMFISHMSIQVCCVQANRTKNGTGWSKIALRLISTRSYVPAIAKRRS